MSSQNLHVVPFGSKWLVRPAGNTKLSSKHSSQSSAILFAQLIAKERQANVIVHKRNGQIKMVSSGNRLPIKGDWN